MPPFVNLQGPLRTIELGYKVRVAPKIFPQWGQKFYRGLFATPCRQNSATLGCGAETETLKAVEWVGNGEGYPLLSRLEGLGERRPKWSWRILRLENTPSVASVNTFFKSLYEYQCDTNWSGVDAIRLAQARSPTEWVSLTFTVVFVALNRLNIQVYV